MVFFMQQNLNPNLKIRKALTQIYGIGSFGSNQLCDQLGLRTHMIVKNMSASQFDQLARVLSHYHMTGQELQRALNQDISRFVRISSYKGFRFTQGLPVRGQRTHSNGKNTRKKVKPVIRST